jgi:hypothetical protein
LNHPAQTAIQGYDRSMARQMIEVHLLTVREELQKNLRHESGGKSS